jgi:divinyl protochlorophyllide a 8-vinyl-reductase
MPATAAISNADRHAGKIGPNAITRVIEALRTQEGPTAVDRIFRAGGLEAYLLQAPADMVDERDVARLHDALHDELGNARARIIGRIAGQLTADYLLGFRIPRPVQMLLRCCPAGVSSPLLAKAIAANSWTFAGTGAFSARHGRPTTFEIQDCPICRGRRRAEPCCDFYAATFERLYRRLVHKRARVIEVACQTKGAPACRFEITW